MCCLLFLFATRMLRSVRAGACLSHLLCMNPWQTTQLWHRVGTISYLLSDRSWNYPIPLSPDAVLPAKLIPGFWLLGVSGSSEPTLPATLSMSNLDLLGL